MSTLSVEQLELQAEQIREDIIRMLEHAGSGHSAGPLGLADIFTALYFDVLKKDPKNPSWEERDILLLSNGHCAPVQYASMARAGYFDVAELMTLRKLGTRLQGHPERTKLPGLENTSGPLGCGLSQASGMAMAMRMNEEHHRWIYVVMGDGELDEGNVWEAAMFASKNKLSNIIGIIDRNNIQIDGFTEDIMPLNPLPDKFRAFNWHVQEIDGHDIAAILAAFAHAGETDQPSVIIAHTIKGKGVPYMENIPAWHGSVKFTRAQADEALEALGASAEEMKELLDV